MTEPRASLDLDGRRRRLRYRAWHRGTREMDLVLGPFADASLPELSGSELDAFEALIEAGDGELFAWTTGTAPVPHEHDTALFRRLRRFHNLPDAAAR